MKSLTGRTIVDASVEPAGDVKITVSRDGRTINSFSIGREQDIPKTSEIRLNKAGTAVIVSVGNKDVDSIPVL